MKVNKSFGIALISFFCVTFTSQEGVFRLEVGWKMYYFWTNKENSANLFINCCLQYLPYFQRETV